MSDNFFKDSKLLGICTKFSRILGLVRDNLCGRIFGTSIIFGAFTLAFRIPNLFRRLFGEGALSAAFIPQLVNCIEKEDEKEAKLFASTIMSITLLVLSFLCVIGIVGSLIARQSIVGDSEWIYILNFTIILLPYLIFICTTALLGSVLNVLKHFLSPALMPILFNIIYITGIIIAWYMYPSLEAASFEEKQLIANQRLIFVCACITGSGVIQMLCLYFVLLKKGWKLTFSFNIKTTYCKKVLTDFLPVTFSMAIFQLNVLMDSLIAVTMTESKHALAALYYSDRIQQLPLGVISISIATAIYPLLSRLNAQEKSDEFRDTLTKATRGLWFLIIPSFIGIIGLKSSLVNVFFAFEDPASTLATSNALLCYSAGLLFTCTMPLLTRSFYAKGALHIPVRVGLVMVVINIVLNIILVKTTDLQGAAIALGTSITSAINVIVMIYFAQNKFQIISFQKIISRLPVILIPSIPLIAWLFFINSSKFDQWVITPINESWSLSSSLIIVCLGAPIGAIIYLGISYILKITELKEIMQR